MNSRSAFRFITRCVMNLRSVFRFSTHCVENWFRRRREDFELVTQCVTYWAIEKTGVIEVELATELQVGRAVSLGASGFQSFRQDRDQVFAVNRAFAPLLFFHHDFAT